jgi:hypothetical protein
VYIYILLVIIRGVVYLVLVILNLLRYMQNNE